MRFVDQYSQIARHSWRSAARIIALSALATGSELTGKSDSALARPRVHFLYLHHVFEDEATAFTSLIKRIRATHTIISHSEAVRRICSGEIDRPLACFSFDDGLKNCMTAARILEEYGARGCFFVCPSIIGETNETKIEAFCRQRLSKPPLEFMDWDDLERLKIAGHEIGSHSMNHANLAETRRDGLTEEIGRSRELLMKRMGTAEHFAWPYGTFAHFATTAKNQVFGAGYTSCASAVRGAHVARHSGAACELCIRRDHVIAAWPVAHTMYFMARSSRLASLSDNQWPDGLRSPAP